MRSSDRRSVAFVGAGLALMLAPFFAGEVPLAWGCALMVGNAFFAFVSGIINHNHMHCATFASPWLNRLFNVALTFARGHTSMTIIVPHNMNHHAHRGRKDDWIRTDWAGSGPLGLRLARYVLRTARNMAIERRRPQAPQLSPPERRQQVIEQIALALFATTLVAWDVRKTICFVAFPWLIGMATLLAVNLLQHDECEPDSEYDHSRNFTGAALNWVFFNNGYHTAHHLFPGVHWSQLKELHERAVRPRMRPELDQASIVAFVWNHR